MILFSKELSQTNPQYTYEFLNQGKIGKNHKKDPKLNQPKPKVLYQVK